ncbi:MAG: Phosphoserine phosphatase (EC [uncultured Campylobacterales bacterium]|uniref:Phosphoserine phosphatase (EC) n=1 Tax=uncultured Campylobacterales bacterium TaxID=352960 RepID=A0A6S6SAM3_9BACT|nr:MAG: Phosphoserine phosphatase (EC [uncultured Campylobacterales bacterium]
MKEIAFFDFDGTITKKDSFIQFIIFSVGVWRFLLGFFILLPILILYKIKLISNYKAKEYVLTYFFKNMRIEDFDKICKNFSEQKIDKMIRVKALKKLNYYKNLDYEVVIVSASIENYLIHWCEKNKLKLIATSIEVKNNLITGKLLSKNCYGKEKVVRIKKLYNLEDFHNIYAYGDSRGDREMLRLTNLSFYKPFL